MSHRPGSFFVALLCAVPALAAQLTVANPTGTAGASVVVPIVFAAQSDTVAALQFDVAYDSASLSLGAIGGDAVRTSAKTLSLADIGPNQRRFLIAGLNGGPLGDGVLFTLFASAGLNAASGSYSLRISNVMAVDPDGQAVNLTASDGSIAVQPASGSVERLRLTGVLNAASLVPGPVAPGEIVTLLGAGIGLPGVGVTFDGAPASLLYTAPNQINLAAPYSLTGKTAAQLRITQASQPVADLAVPVADASPAVFSLDGSGLGPGAILNQDANVNSPLNPAPRGSIVSLFATGAGQTDAASKPLLTVSVQIGGVDAPVFYAGGAPGLVSGVLQVNCMVPAAAPTGVFVPLTLTVGTTAGPAGITLAVN
jgi:uncharacterized protein (TIGR03437 family)